MKLSELFDKNAFFRSETEIKEHIKNSKNYNNELPGSANLLMFFQTSKQRTYLVATTKRLYCILDDARKDKPHINWSMPMNEVVDNNELLFTLNTKEKSPKTGLIDIGPKHKNWLFSTSLFNKSTVTSTIEKFLLSSMKNT